MSNVSQVVVSEVTEYQVGDGAYTASPEALQAAPESFEAFNKQMDAAGKIQATPAIINPDTAPTAEPVVESPVEPPAPETPSQPEVQPAQPQPQAAATEPEVPAKFKDKDGKVRLDALVKSYQELEKAHSRAKQQPGPVPAPTPFVPPANPQVADPFVARLEDDVRARGLGPVLKDLFEAAADVSTQRATADIQSVKEAQQAARYRAEIEGISEQHPEVLSEAGYKKLLEVIEARPYLTQSPTPFQDAFYVLKGQGGLSPQAGMVTKPTPTAQAMPKAQVRAPAPAANVVKIETQADLDKHLSTLSPEKQMEFMSKRLGWKV